jgi:outer membrane protein assembly factor BamB
VWRWILLAIGAIIILAGGAVLALWLRTTSPPEGELETDLEGVSVVQATEAAPPATTAEAKPRKRTLKYLPTDRLCWKNFGGNPQRTLARPNLRIGLPTRHFWVKGLRGYIEYPPSYCDGMLYVNTYNGITHAIDQHNGRIAWKRRNPGPTPSTPAIAGDRLLVSSTGGAVTAYRRTDGKKLWQLRVRAKVESSPVVVGGVAYFGATDGHFFAINAATGRVRWAFDTGGRINASPSVYGNRICITTYAGSIFCLDRRNGRKLWSTYVRRDPFRFESFYASPSTDGARIYTIARSGKVVALSARTGKILWTHGLRSLGYSTPAVARGRVFIGDFRGYLHAYRSTTGRELWRRKVRGKILGPAFVAGNFVFVSTLAEHTYALRASDGRIMWHVAMGKYSPGIATDRHYFFSLNGIMIAYHAQRPARYKKAKRATAGSVKPRVTTTPKR